METILDLIVIGGGPAGFAAAVQLNAAGCTVCIVTKAEEKNSGPRPAESVHPGTEVLLAQLKLPGAIKASSAGTYTGIYSGDHFSPLSTLPGEVWTGHHIDRNIFDEYLLDAAAASGIRVLRGETMLSFDLHNEIYTVSFKSGLQLRSKFLADASGRTRLLGKRLKLEEKIFSPELTAWSGIAENIPADELQRISTRFTPANNGWAWFAAEPPGKCTWTRTALKEEADLLPPDELKNYPCHTKKRQANVQWRIFRPLFINRILLTGDAAAILDPGAGQGILHALMSGMMAAEAIRSSIAEPASEKKYLQGYDAWFTDTYYKRLDELSGHYKRLGILVHEMQERRLS